MLTPAYCVFPEADEPCAATAEATGLAEATAVRLSVPCTSFCTGMEPTRRADGHQRSGCSLCRRSSLCCDCGTARNALRVVVVLVLARVARHTGRGASEAVAAALRVSRAVGCDSSCDQRREDVRVTSHGTSL